MHSFKPILVVEDNAEDFTALNRAFRKHGLPNPVLRCEDGDEALTYLQSFGQPLSAPAAALPVIVLLDLNLPGTDGRTVLETMKRDGRLASIPVIIFSSSANLRDVEDCYRLGANSYLTKPIEYAALEDKVRLALRYWLESSELPLMS